MILLCLLPPEMPSPHLAPGPCERRHRLGDHHQVPIGKLPAASLVAADVAAEIAAEGFVELPVTVRHAQRAGAISGPHKDPFDRMLIAQSLEETLTLVSNETLFDGYGVTRLWV